MEFKYLIRVPTNIMFKSMVRNFGLITNQCIKKQQIRCSGLHRTTTSRLLKCHGGLYRTTPRLLNINPNPIDFACSASVGLILYTFFVTMASPLAYIFGLFMMIGSIPILFSDPLLAILYFCFGLVTFVIAKGDL